MQAALQIEPLLVSFIDGCRAVGLGSTKFQQMVNDGTVESVLVGRRRLIVHESLKALVAKLRAEQSKIAA